MSDSILRAVFPAAFAALTLFPGAADADLEAVSELPCFLESLDAVVEVDFEGLPEGASICSPLERSGARFSDPGCIEAGFCSSPTCAPDPDNLLEGNMVILLGRGATIDFPAGTEGALLELQGMGSSPFALRATDRTGGSLDAEGRGVSFGVARLGFLAPGGLARVEVLSAGGGGGSLAIAQVFLGGRLKAPPPRCGQIESTFLVPRVTDSIRFFPAMGILENAPVNEAQSTYFKTTDRNREFRRGFMEFSIPEFGASIRSATLHLSDCGGSAAAPPGPDVHQLSYYEADLVVDPRDFDRPTSLIGFLETHAPVPHESFRIDVRDLVREFQGRSLGFRIKLAADPYFDGFASFRRRFRLPGG